MIKLNHYWKRVPPGTIDAAEITYRRSTIREGRWLVTLSYKVGFSHNAELIASASCDTEEERDAVVATIRDIAHARSAT